MTDVPPVDTVQSARPGRWLKLALAVSLAINLCVVGLVAGVALRDHGEGRSGPAAVRDLNFGPFSEALTRDQRRALLRAFAEGGTGLRDARAQMRDDLDAVMEALRRTPFDAGAFRQAIERQSQRITARAEDGREALIGLVLAMSEPERAAFAERLEQTVSRRGNRGSEMPHDRMDRDN